MPAMTRPRITDVLTWVDWLIFGLIVVDVVLLIARVAR